MKTSIPLVDLRAQYKSLRREIDAAIHRVIHASAFIGGREVEEFEAAFAKYCGTRFAVGVSSGTNAIVIALKALGLKPGEGVIVPSFTFIASAHAIMEAGLTPVVADVDPIRYTLDPESCERVLAKDRRAKKVRAILPVHLYGQPADMDALRSVARRHNLLLVEDAAQAHGARLAGRRAGSLGHAGCFSFYPSKNLGAYGDGGMIVTNDPKAAESAQRLRNHGRSSKTKSKYIHFSMGGNSRLDGLQAAILGVKLRHLDEWNERRRRAASVYTDLLQADRSVRTPVIAEKCQHVFHIYAVLVRNRDRVFNALRTNGVGAEIHYPVPVHLQPSLKACGYRRGDFPVSEMLSKYVLSLPLYPEITPAQIKRVVRLLKSAAAS